MFVCEVKEGKRTAKMVCYRQLWCCILLTDGIDCVDEETVTLGEIGVTVPRNATELNVSF